ncbi:MAG: EAL domain-containing protein, partial [Xenococcaceae cyanobacterium MO_188.B19]|nr:EAL domain-containing protein [Xenococcaceae cyanobacterium MO_188.B19]
SEFLIREHPHTAMAIIPTLKELGVELTIDNFGRIGSQYNCCQPQALYKEFDRIKIDRYLINRIDKDPESLDLLKQMFDKVVDYGIPIIAVGVETKEQLDHIKVMSCQYAQGSLFHRPLKLPKLEQIFLKNCEIAS